jgi:hypothetical protein
MVEPTLQNYAKIDSILNPADGKLPFGYYSPDSDGKLTWNCGEDAGGKIISVFACDMGTHKDKKMSVLSNMKEAIFARDQLVEAGWKKLKPPEITVKYEDGKEKPLTRKQKRYLSKTVAKMSKDNPFDDEET